ncbi:MAG: hypothetical protein K2W92_07270 [Alphaproteobacteria bacterium]|nr:hypothetical protein [Alphaproteobacteria bacterium]
MNVINTLMVSCLLLISSMELAQAKVEHNTHVNYHTIQTSAEFQNLFSHKCDRTDPRCR